MSLKSRVWFERICLIVATSLFHYFPVPTAVGVALFIVVRIASIKSPDEFNTWR